MFYVYEWFNIDTNEIFYVGKGCKNRYKVKNRNKKFNYYLDNNNCDVRIIKYFENEQESFYYEEYRISQLKKIGQCSCNIKYGGNGGVKGVWTEEMKERMSKYNPMKSPEQKERMSKNNPMKNKEYAKKNGLSHSKEVKIGSKNFISIKDACEYYNISYSVFKKWIKNKMNPYGEECYLVKNKDVYNYNCLDFNDKIKYTNRIQYGDMYFNTLREVGEFVNRNPTTILKWLKRGYSPNGIICKREQDKNIYIFKKKDVNESKRKPIIVNGILYESIVKASKELNINTETIRNHLKNKNIKNNKYVCEYANQKPSQ